MRLSLGRFASGSLTYLAANLVSAAVPFLLIPVLTRHLTTAEYGQVGLFMALVTGLATLTGLNTNGAAARKVYDDLAPAELSNFVGACLQIMLASTTLVLLLALALGDAPARWLGLEPRWVLGAIAICAASYLVNLRLTQWQVRRQAAHYGGLQVLQSLLLMGLTLLLVVGLDTGAEGRIGAQLVAATACMAIAFHSLRRDGLLGWAWRPAYLREALQFGLPLVPHVTGIFLLGMADRFFINERLGAGEAGVYMVAVQLCALMGILFDAINKAYIPWLFERLKRDDPAEKRQTVRLTYAYFAGALTLAGLFTLAGPAAIHLLAGGAYAGAAAAVGWLALGQAFGGGYFMVTNYIFYSKRTGMMSLATLSCGALNLALLLWLVDDFGLRGAAMAYAAAMAARFFWMWWLAQRRHPMPWSPRTAFGRD